MTAALIETAWAAEAEALRSILPRTLIDARQLCEAHRRVVAQAVAHWRSRHLRALGAVGRAKMRPSLRRRADLLAQIAWVASNDANAIRYADIPPGPEQWAESDRLMAIADDLMGRAKALGCDDMRPGAVFARACPAPSMPALPARCVARRRS